MSAANALTVPLAGRHWTGRQILLWGELRSRPVKQAKLDDLARKVGFWVHPAGGAAQPNRGRVSDNFAMFRFHRVLGYASVRGRGGSVRWWFGAGLRRGVGTVRFRERRLTLGNDSLSPFGGFCSKEWLLEHWSSQFGTSGGGPPGRASRGAAGPRRGRPPRRLYASCPTGHRVRNGRWSWRPGSASFRAEYHGWCRRCRARIVDVFELRAPLPALRPRSPEELADRALLERRRAMAARLVASDLPWAVRELARRQYLDPREE